MGPKKSTAGSARDVFSTPTGRLRWRDIRSFLYGEYPEDARIDYKLDMTDRITETIAAMANTRGGVILVGVDEDKARKTPLLPPVGISIRKHQGGGTLVNYCHTGLQPVYLPSHSFVPISGKKDKAVLVVQVRSDEAPIPVRDEQKGFLVRIGDQNRPADLQTLKALLAVEDDRMAPVYDTEAMWMGALRVSGPGPTSIVVGGVIRRRDLYGDWTSKDRRRLIGLVLRFIDNGGATIVSHADSIRIEKDGPTTWIGMSARGAFVVRFSWSSDPFPLAAVLVGLRTGLGILLSPDIAEVYDPIRPIEVTLGFANWPLHGLKTMPLFEPARLDVGDTSRQSNTVSRTYNVAAKSDSWPIIRRFVGAVLADAGYVDYESYLDHLESFAADAVMEGEGLQKP